MTNSYFRCIEKQRVDMELITKKINEYETSFSSDLQTIATCKYIEDIIERLIDISTGLENQNLSHLLEVAAQEAYLEQRTGEIRVTHV
jgi:hypothetical protein